jgi:phosphate transport system substrate-binding protein
MKRFHTILIITLIITAACGDKDKYGKPVDSPTYGTIKIAVDESLQPLVDAEIKTFQGIYRNAAIASHYTSEAEAIDLLLKDSVRMIVITRMLSAEESADLQAQQIVPHNIVIAHEGIAIIMNRARRDSLLSVSQVRDILTGKITQWNQLFKSSSSDSLKIVFDSPSSGILRHLKDTLGFEKLSSNCYAVNNNPSVVDYVSKNKNTVGLIGTSWISDADDSTANHFLNTIRVGGLQHDSSYYQPYQAYIAQHSYPLARKVIIISREARTGLASGFTAFVAGDKGQRIVLKAGLVPATMPIRIVEVNQEPFEY